MISKVPFIVRLSDTLTIEDIYPLQSEQGGMPENYVASLYVPLYYQGSGKSFYLKASYFGNEEQFSSAKSIMRCYVVEGQVRYRELLPFSFPEFFIKNRYYSNFNNCSFTKVARNIYFFYSFVPKIYDLTGNKAYEVKKTSFERTTLSLTSPGKNKIAFKMQAVFRAGNGNAYFGKAGACDRAI